MPRFGNIEWPAIRDAIGDELREQHSMKKPFTRMLRSSETRAKKTRALEDEDEEPLDEEQHEETLYEEERREENEADEAGHTAGRQELHRLSN